MNRVTEEYVFIDRRKNPFVLTDKLVIFKWLPFIGVTGFALYSVYIALTNKDHGYAFPSLNRLRKYLKKDKKTIIKYNRLLEQYGLISIERVQSSAGDFTSNRYYINEVPDIPYDLVPEYEKIKLVERDPIENTRNKGSNTGGGFIPPPSGNPNHGGSRTNPPPSGTTPPPVVESLHPNKTKDNENNLTTLSPEESDLKIPDHSIFSMIPKPSIKKLIDKYSEQNVLEAIKSLDRVYEGRNREVRSPFALLKTALEEGFEPVRIKPQKKKARQKPKSQEQIELEQKRIRIQEKYTSLDENVKNAWNDLLERFSTEVSTQVFETWFNPLVPIVLEGNVLFVNTSSQTIADYIEKKWLNILRKCIIGQSYPFDEIELVS
ncbi:helix-turn-helix domain-containing protein [bacterium]|nr:helix-turn-helix domain-containing protein [bacterium]